MIHLSWFLNVSLLLKQPISVLRWSCHCRVIPGKECSWLLSLPSFFIRRRGGTSNFRKTPWTSGNKLEKSGLITFSALFVRVGQSQVSFQSESSLRGLYIQCKKNYDLVKTFNYYEDGNGKFRHNFVFGTIHSHQWQIRLVAE